MIAQPYSYPLSNNNLRIISNRRRENAPSRRGHTDIDGHPNSKFLQQVTQLVETNLSDEHYGILELCEDAGISRAQLHRKLKASVKQSASKFIRNIRLDRAITLLHYTDLNISEVAYEVGFGDPKYFSRVFSQEFNQSPRSFRDQTEAAGHFLTIRSQRLSTLWARFIEPPDLPVFRKLAGLVSHKNERNNNPTIRDNSERMPAPLGPTLKRYPIHKITSKMKDKEMLIPNQDQTSNQYVIRGGKPGRDRLQVLHCALAPSTLAFFERVGITYGQQGLDLGCGGGALSRELAQLVGSAGQVTGIDKDAENISYARQKADMLGLTQLRYEQADICSWDGAAGHYDFAYARFLLSHLPDPAVLIGKIFAWLKPGGHILLEDVDFTGHFCYPECTAFSAYVAWYTASVRCMGADPNIGPRLPSLVQRAGFRELRFSLVQPVFQSGEGKQMSSLTLENIKESLIRNQLASNKEIDTSLTELRVFEEDEHTLVSLPRIFQVWAVK